MSCIAPSLSACSTVRVKCPLPPVTRSSRASAASARTGAPTAIAIARLDGGRAASSTVADGGAAADGDDAADVGAELAGADDDRQRRAQ